MNSSPHTLEILLDQCVSSMLSRDLTADECLGRYPEQRGELAPLLHLVDQLRAASTLSAPPEFRQAAVTRMQNLTSARPRQAARRRPSGLPLAQWLPRAVPRWLGQTVLLVMVMILLLVSGNMTVQAANRTVPGQPLYGLKRALEAVRIKLAGSEIDDARLHMEFASRRIDESEQLLVTSRYLAIHPLLISYEEQIDAALTHLRQESELSDQQRTDVAEMLLPSFAANEAELLELLERAPAELRPIIEHALEAARQGYRNAIAILHGETAGPDHSPPLPVLTPTGVYLIPPATELWRMATPTTGTPFPTPPLWPVVTTSPGAWPAPYVTPFQPVYPTWPTDDWPEDTSEPTGWPTDWPWPTEWQAEETPEPEEWPTDWPAWPTNLPSPPETPSAPGTPPAPPPTPVFPSSSGERPSVTSFP